jgi:hypothetical protein
LPKQAAKFAFQIGDIEGDGHGRWMLRRVSWTRTREPLTSSQACTFKYNENKGRQL